MGLAYAGVGRLGEAKQKFEALREEEHIAIGKLYAEYGLALVAYKMGETGSARGLIEEIRDKLSRRTASNLLLKLINQLYDELDGKHMTA